MKLSCTIDLTKIDKTRIVERKYTNKDGVEVTQKNYSFDVVELKEPKTIKETDRYTMKKTHFIAESQTKEERDAKKLSNFIGDVISFTNPGDMDQAFNNITSQDLNEAIPF